ncbi:MAG: ABC transporter permease, partial [Chloroflexi bacterium]|nr:ABC transporter permease [Chloroflexota bacterium]
MRTYIFRRVALLPILLVAVSLLIFSLVRILPGDVALAKFGGEAPREMIDAVRRSLGLDRPIYEQYLSWVSGFVTGDFGTSLWTETPVLQEFLHALPVTLELTVLASVVAVLIGVSTGIISAVRQDTWLDHVARLGGIAGLAMPGFWLGTLFLLLPSLWLGWAPPLLYQSLLENPWDNLRQFI